MLASSELAPNMFEGSYTDQTACCDLKPNSITLAGSELAPNMFGASSEPTSVTEFGRELASSC